MPYVCSLCRQVTTGDNEKSHYGPVLGCIPALQARLAEVKAELQGHREEGPKTARARDAAETALRRHGYRRSCDSPACNCGDQWTHGGHANRRLTEVAEVLGERTQGRTILAAVQTLLDEHGALTMALQAAKELDAIRFAALQVAEAKLVDAGALHLADESTIVQLTTQVSAPPASPPPPANRLR